MLRSCINDVKLVDVANVLDALDLALIELVEKYTVLLPSVILA